MTEHRSFRTAPTSAGRVALETVDGVLWMRAGEGFSGRGEVARFDCGTGDDRFALAESSFADFLATCDVSDEVNVPGSGPLAFGSFTFDGAESGSVLIVPETVTGSSAGAAWTTVAGDPEYPRPAPAVDFGRVRYSGSSLSELDWLDAVAGVEKSIRAEGVPQKVVLARDVKVWAEDHIDPRLVVRRLARRFPQCFTFFCAGLVGATPELLLRRVGRRVESLVLAGSAARGTSEEDDRRIAGELLASDKDVREHRLAVDSVLSCLREVCDGIQVSGPRVLQLENVQHLATTIEASLMHDLSSLALAARLHPTAAVGGVPRAHALNVIRTVEGMSRGRYAGPVGWMDARGNGEWGIALRCAELDGSHARLFAGAGIVAGSRPEAELEETRLKLRAMQSALSLAEDYPGER